MTTNSHTPAGSRLDEHREAHTRASLRTVLTSLAMVVVFGALGVLVAGTVSTAQSRFAGSTSNEGSIITTGAIEIVVERDSQDSSSTAFTLLFDVDMTAEQTESRCVEVTYRGSVDGVIVGLYGQVGGGTGLEAFLDTRVRLGSGTDASCSDFVASTTVFDGTLEGLVEAHDSLPTSIPLLVSPSSGAVVTVEVAVTLSSDNAAQGLTTAFGLSIEART